MQKKKKTKRNPSRIRELIHVIHKHRILRGISPYKVRCVLEDMGPTYVKLGQILSMHSEILPQTYCDELQKLRAQVHPVPFDEVRALIEEELQKPIEEIFSEIDQTPLGSASIAQVYRAVLRESGENVVVKVQRPGIYDMMKRDIPLMKKAVNLLRISGHASDALDFHAIIDEMWKVAKQEMNFLIELSHMQKFAELNQNICYVSCPVPIAPLTTPRVLVMQYIDGIPIDHTAKLRSLGYNMNEIGLKLAENYAKQIFDDAFFHADPHPDNIWIHDGKIVFLDLGMMGALSERDRALLRNAMIAVAQEDIQELKKILLMLGDVKGKINHSRLFSDIDQMVLKYANLSLGDIHLGRLIQELLDLAKEYNIGMPASITLLARGVMTIEGVISDCCPDVNLIQIITNHLAGKEFKDFDLKKEFLSNGQSLYSLLKKGMEIPVSLANLAKMAVKGQAKVNLELVGSDEPLKKIDGMVNRLITCIIAASLILGSSIICATNIAPFIFGVPVLGAIGFTIALILSVKLCFDTIFRHK